MRQFIFLAIATMVMTMATTAMAQSSSEDCECEEDCECLAEPVLENQNCETVFTSQMTGVQRLAVTNTQNRPRRFPIKGATAVVNRNRNRYVHQKGASGGREMYEAYLVEAIETCQAQRRTRSRSTKRAPSVSQEELTTLSSQLDALETAMRQGDTQNSEAISSLSDEVQEGFTRVNREIEELRASTLDPETLEELEGLQDRVDTLEQSRARVRLVRSGGRVRQELVEYELGADGVSAVNPRDNRAYFTLGARLSVTAAEQFSISPAVQLGVNIGRISIFGTLGYTCNVAGEGCLQGFQTEPGLDITVFSPWIGIRMQGLLAFAFGSGWNNFGGGIGPVVNLDMGSMVVNLAALFVGSAQSQLQPDDTKATSVILGCMFNLGISWRVGAERHPLRGRAPQPETLSPEEVESIFYH